MASMVAAGFAAPAEAQMFWPTEPDGYAEPPRYIEQRRPRVVRSRPKLPDAPKETAKPVGPIVIAISIDQQHLKLYDRNGLFAESPVSTGMRGHATPMGVFSIIQKNKYHRSNIYSGAPMPYMQRVTWSGIALHAGALPGYPASHGCIRMPMNFAMRMWGWTRMGARVIITPDEVSPTDVSHPLLIARKPDQSSVAAAAPGRTDQTATSLTSGRSSIVDAAFEKAELRLTPITDRREPIRTADASGAMAVKDDAGRTALAQAWDANRGASWDAGRGGVTPEPEAAKQGAKDGARDTAKTPSSDPAKDGAAKDDATTGGPDGKPAPAEETSPGGGGGSGDKKSEGPAIDKKQTRVADAAAPAREGSAEFIGPVKPRSGHVAAYVSRKDSKIYVRQNFEPWIEAPVTIAASDRPLGTHVFTARADKDDADAFRWSVVSLPAPVRAARSDDDTPRRRRVVADAIPAAPPASPIEALDRLTIPDETMKRIASALMPGGSLVVSDHGLGDETGRGTDFIVPLR